MLMNLGITVKEAIAVPAVTAHKSFSQDEKILRLLLYKLTDSIRAAAMRKGMPLKHPQIPEAVIRAHDRQESANAFHVLSLRYESKDESAAGIRMTIFMTGANCAVSITCADSAYIIPSRNE